MHRACTTRGVERNKYRIGWEKLKEKRTTRKT
jgi:hypothetical protein